MYLSKYDEVIDLVSSCVPLGILLRHRVYALIWHIASAVETVHC